MRKPPPLGAPGVAEVVKQRCPQTHSLLLKVTKITMIIGIRAFSHTPTQGSNQNRPCTARPQDLHFYQFQNLCGTGTLSHYSEYIHQVQSKQTRDPESRRWEVMQRLGHLQAQQTELTAHLQDPLRMAFLLRLWEQKEWKLQIP